MNTVIKVFLLIILTSTHGHANKITEKLSKVLERDTLAVEMVTNLGLALKCLTDVVGESNTIGGITKVLSDAIIRAQKIPADSLIKKHYMDTVIQETTITVADLSAINPACSSVTTYCQHRSDAKKSAVSKEMKDLQMYLSLIAPMAKCLMHNNGEDMKEQIYEKFENAVLGIRKDLGDDITPVKVMYLQAKYVGTELLKLDDKCKQSALSYDHCAPGGQ